jgi:F420-dependent oxidoreductase-like protein
VKFSIWPSSAEPAADLVDLARYAERAGWDGFWVADHFMPHGGDLGEPMLECWSLISALALAVPRIRLGALVSGNTYRHPAVLAKSAVTADHLSGGRVVLGLGAGWQENEHLAYGIEFYTLKERMERLEEACSLIKLLVSNDRSDFSGRYYSLGQAPFEPKPVGRLPLLIGGAGEKVTMRIAARHADEWNCWGTPEVLAHKTRVLDRHCERLGRDPGEIKRSAQAALLMSDSPERLRELVESGPWPRQRIIGSTAEVLEQLCGYVESGVDEFIVPLLGFGPRGEREDKLDAFIEAVRSVPELSPPNAG